jgi:hypothetical protein
LLRVTHKLIGEKIAAELKLSEEDTQLLVSGLLGPDSHVDFPHQTGKDKKILDKIETARELFLINDDECYGELGNALHYIQDKLVHDTNAEQVATLVEDMQFVEAIAQSLMTKKTIKAYLKLANSLLTIKNSGIESWFSHSWGIWHKDLVSCVYVFAEMLELLLPTLQPDTEVFSNKERWKSYLKSEGFKNSIQDGFRGSLKVNFLYPKISGYPAAIYTLASLAPPSDYCNAFLDLNVVYRLSLEIARCTLSPPEGFKYADSWTQKGKVGGKKRMYLAFVLPRYHVLINRPVDEVHEERKSSFESSRQDLLANWSSIENSLDSLRQHSDLRKNLVIELVELLRQS